MLEPSSSTINIRATLVFFAIIAASLPLCRESRAQTTESEPAASATPSATPNALFGPAPTTPPQRPLKPRPRNKGASNGPQPGRPSGEYQFPLRFDPEDNGFSIDNPQLTYEMASQDAVSLGGVLIDGKKIVLNVDQTPRANVPVRLDKHAGTSKLVTHLSLSWPAELTRIGEVTLETIDGKVFWKRTVDEAELKRWQTDLGQASAEMKKLHKDSLWGEFDVRIDEVKPLFRGTRFRFCLNKTAPPEDSLRVCSRPYTSRSSGERLQLKPLDIKRLVSTGGPAATSFTREPGLYLSDKKLNKNGLINFPTGKPVKMNVTFTDQSFIEIAGSPSDPRLIDVIESPDGSEIYLTGSGAKPIGKTRVLEKPLTHFWAPTGIPQDLIWQVAIPRDIPTIKVIGSFGIPYTLLFTGDRVPTDAERVYIRKSRSYGTYSSSPLVFGYIPSGGSVSSDQYGAMKTDRYHFQWNFAAPKNNGENRALLSVQSAETGTANEKPWVAHLKIHRSPPFEASLRSTAIVSSDLTFIMMGEVSAAAWFESIGFTQSPLLSKQRWGIAGHYLRSLSKMQSESGAKIESYDTMNFNLKYNVLPGIWHRDEIFGLLASHQQLNLAYQTGKGASAATKTDALTFYGVGFYWARTMPKIFNDLFNLLPYMDYPKYVDLEFIYYPLTPTAGSSTNATFTINFHGRVFWAPTFYGEAGFGLRNYDYTAPNLRGTGTMAQSFSTAYGTLGLGFVF